MYDPKIARFLQEDTYLGETNDPLSLNLYTYCHNEPIMYIDPTGHWEQLDDKYIKTQDPELYKKLNGSDKKGGLTGAYLNYSSQIKTLQKKYHLADTLNKARLSEQIIELQKNLDDAKEKAKKLRAAFARTNREYAEKKYGSNWTVSLGIEDFKVEYEEKPGLPYEPDKWNNKARRQRTNCYAYALNMQRFPDGRLFPYYEFVGMEVAPGKLIGFLPGIKKAGGIQPGELAMYFSKYNLYRTTFLKNDNSNIVECVIKDANTVGRKCTTLDNSESKCPKNTYKICVAWQEENGGDYHFFRQNEDGTWSSKPGIEEVKLEEKTNDAYFMRYDKYDHIKYFAIEKPNSQKSK